MYTPTWFPLSLCPPVSTISPSSSRSSIHPATNNSYERKARSIKKAEAIGDLQTLTQRAGPQGNAPSAASSLSGPRVFCKMAGTVGCKQPVMSGISNVHVCPSFIPRHIPFIHQPFSPSLPPLGCYFRDHLQSKDKHLSVCAQDSEGQDPVHLRPPWRRLRCGKEFLSIPSNPGGPPAWSHPPCSPPPL